MSLRPKDEKSEVVNNHDMKPARRDDNTVGL